jgi:hypothetical protein
MQCSCLPEGVCSIEYFGGIFREEFSGGIFNIEYCTYVRQSNLKLVILRFPRIARYQGASTTFAGATGGGSSPGEQHHRTKYHRASVYDLQQARSD